MSEAERLLGLARSVLIPRRLLLEYPTVTDIDKHAGTIALAIRFASVSGGTQVRAMVEEWNRARIVRECY